MKISAIYSLIDLTINLLSQLPHTEDSVSKSEKNINSKTNLKDMSNFSILISL